MIGSIIGGATSALGGLFGGIGARRAAKKARNITNTQLKENEAWYNKNYNQDYTTRSDAQALLGKAREQAKRQYKIADNTGVISGATPEATALQKAAGNQMYANTLSGINQYADRYKQGIMDRYLNTKAELNNRQYNSYMNQSQQWANMATNALTAGMGAMQADGFDFDFNK